MLLLKHEKWFDLTLSLFRAPDSNMKNVLSAFYTFVVLVKNKKILPSELVTFTLVKESEWSTSRG